MTKLTPEQIRDISEQIYKIRLGQDWHDNVERMLEKDGDGGVKLRRRAGFYDSLTRVYLDVLSDMGMIEK